jgi:hypothetical protein
MHRKKPMSQRSYKTWRTVGVAVACVATVLLLRWGISGSSGLSGATDGFSAANGKTLIIHIFADTDPEYLENLKFFVQWGIPPQDQSDYVVVVQSTDSAVVGLAVLSLTAAVIHECLNGD